MIFKNERADQHRFDILRHCSLCAGRSACRIRIYAKLTIQRLFHPLAGSACFRFSDNGRLWYGVTGVRPTFRCRELPCSAISFCVFFLVSGCVFHAERWRVFDELENPRRHTLARVQWLLARLCALCCMTRAISATCCSSDNHILDWLFHCLVRVVDCPPSPPQMMFLKRDRQQTMYGGSGAAIAF